MSHVVSVITLLKKKNTKENWTLVYNIRDHMLLENIKRKKKNRFFILLLKFKREH
jgi:hypothetical protein